MKRLTAILTGASILALSAAAAPVAARVDRDFAAGANTEQQDCRALARFDRRDSRAVDLYCGAWERPSGFVAAYPIAKEAEALARLRDACEGQGPAIASGDLDSLQQIACSRSEGSSLRRFGMIAREGGQIIVGVSYPSDWGPMVSSARVLAGLERPERVASTAGAAPGLSELAAVYPAGAPGQGAQVNHELLRRRAYEHNAVWSFSAAEKDFSELLRSHEAVSPDDDEGAAEILAEIGINLSGERRFAEADAAFDRAEARAREADAKMLLTKIGNYRALDALNQGRRKAARDFALAANAARDELLRRESGFGFQITEADSGQIETAAAARSGRGLLMSMGQMSEAARAAVLSAQGEYIAAVASRGMGQRDAAFEHLNAATGRLAASEVQPGWLVAQIYKERSRLRLEAGDTGAAQREAQAGLTLLRRDAPGTRAEGHLLLALADARRGAGDLDAALSESRAAVAIFGQHRETPGMPADVAASHLDALRTAWAASNDQALADEYFQTLTLVWDGAAARSAAQLAARLAASEGGDSVRAYQDAERGYRAALARRERLSSAPDVEPRMIQVADREVTSAATRLEEAEGDLRSKSPRYVELLSPKLGTGDLVRVLEEGEGYVRLVVSEDKVYGALVTRQGVTPFVADLSEERATALSDRIRKSVQLRRGMLPDYDIEAASELYARLFAPLEGQMADLTRLQIDAAGPLASVPYAALVTAAPDAAQQQRIKRDQDYSGISWFGRQKSVAIALGPAAFVRTRTHTAPLQATAAVTFGDFQPDPALVAERIAARRNLSDKCRKELEAVLHRLGALPETRAEAEATAAAFGAHGRAVVGEAFTDASLLGDASISEASVLVLATHGVLGLSNCFAEPALLATPGDGDGLIEASELLDLKLNARLVVMSACDTAGGGRLDASRTGFADGGEALSGLARAFIYAGASSVLATHWKIDAATSSLQTQKLLTQAVSSGQPLSAALSDAQKALYEDAETAHPFYWSGFVLIGDGGTTLSAGPTTQAAASSTAGAD